QITVSATRVETNRLEVPVSVTVITDVEIANQMVTDIKDLVKFEPGVSVRSAPARFTAAGANTGRDGNSGFNIRGLEGNRILIQSDGIRMPEAFAFGGQSVGRGDYQDLDLLKSVEILRGPASALYGSDGVAGAVSFITKDPADFLNGKDWAIHAKTGYASADNSWSKGAVGAVGVGAFEAFVAYTRRDAHEQKNQGTDFSLNTDRTAPNPQDIWSNAVLAKGVYHASDTNTFRVTYEHFDRAVDSVVYTAVAKPPLAATSVLGLTARDDTDRDRVSVDQRYEGEDGDIIEKASWAAYYQKSKNREYANEDRNTAADRLRINLFDNRVIGLNTELRAGFGTGAIDHTIVVGGDISETRQTGLRDGTVPPAGETFPTRAFPTTDYLQAGVFIQDELAFLDGAITAYPALRLDHYKLTPKVDPLFTAGTSAGKSDTHLSPKIGVLGKVNSLIGLFANYSEGFKAPSPSQVNNGFANVVANYRSVPNPDLKPETSETIEGGIRFTDPMWSGSITGFSGSYKNFIDQIQVSGNFTAATPAVYQYINRGSVKLKGIEAEGRAILGYGFSAIVAGSYSRGNATTAGVTAPLDSVDPVKIVAGLNYRSSDDTYGGQLSVTHSNGKDVTRTSNICAPSCYTPKGFEVVDLTAFYNVTENVTLRAGVFNVFDTKYWWWSDVRGLASTSTIKDSYTQPSRNASVSLAVQF
ncbi:MAG: TonB-dependent hemoglobin/transferrin/lactoferrin family receptor, partial [Rhodospirillaceae bacterium]|nr:TonB-dependent hemoglobin/transferrin/lactoferrin family receptor [Rhodospirillaceae bacterium]